MISHVFYLVGVQPAAGTKEAARFSRLKGDLEFKK